MKKIILVCVLLFVVAFNSAFAFTRGIYITQSTLENKTKLHYLIQQAKKYDIDTFVIDVNIPSKRYAENIKDVLRSGIHYVARLVIFPHGGTHAQITDKSVWEKRLALAHYAVSLGATSIQLDYIRYEAANPPNPEKAKHVYRVVEFFKNQLARHRVALQIDIFGIAAHKPAHTIGQDPSQLAPLVNVFCPMVYPSHFEPFLVHAKQPYETILKAVTALKKQLREHPHVAIVTYIELYNYRYKLTAEEKLHYIAAQIKATKDSGADGWYVWSPNNHYEPLFQVLSGKS